MPAKKKPVPYSRPRLSRSEGEVALMKAAYELMTEIDVADITTTDIAERAGLNRAHISRYFTTRNELLSAAIEYDFFERFNRVIESRKSDPSVQYDLFGAEADQLRLRNKVVAYLISVGVPQARFHESQRFLTERLTMFLHNDENSERTNNLLGKMSALLMIGYQASGELIEATEQDRADMLQLMAVLPSNMKPIEKLLGWK